jgi:protease-4
VQAVEESDRVKKNPWLMLLVLLVFFGGLWAILFWTTSLSIFGSTKTKNFSMGRGDLILRLKIDGVIMDGKKFIDPLLEYKDDTNVKAIVIEINSPGGVVGPSQEIYEEIRRVREETKKPVVAVSTGLCASGALYSAVAADKIMVQPGTLLGSIGVIMEFTNLEKLYDWANVSRFSINTGKYKDSGAEYRPMRDDERQVFQTLVNDVLEQFIEAVAAGRNMKVEDVRAVADGRVFTGRQAIELGLADEIGTREDAFKLAAKLAGLEEGNYEIMDPPEARPSLFQLLTGDGEDSGVHFDRAIDSAMKKILKTELTNRPLFLMPGAY